MVIKNVKISNFRNIESLNFEPCKEINLIFGLNAQGKTNILDGRRGWLSSFARYLNTLNRTSPRRHRGSQNTFLCQFYVFICLNYENNSVIPNDKVLKKKSNISKIFLYEACYFSHYLPVFSPPFRSI